MLGYAGLKWYLIELAFYGAGVGLYAVCLRARGSTSSGLPTDEHRLEFRIPERLAPGTFDIWGNSHQIFHVAILCAMCTHTIALLQGFQTSHTLDVCRLQGVSGAN